MVRIHGGVREDKTAGAKVDGNGSPRIEAIGKATGGQILQTLSVYRRGQTGSKATGYEQENLKRAIPPRVHGLREPRFRRPLERIGDPQISPTRQTNSPWPD
jgi:hypothetical protein